MMTPEKPAERIGLSQLVGEARRMLSGPDGETIIRLLSRHLLKVDRATMIVDPDRQITATDAAKFRKAVDRCSKGMPVHRAIGMRSFHGLDLHLNEATLEPRDDSEALIELVVDLMQERRDAPLAIADLGTGTGALALALLSEFPDAYATLSDLSERALDAARDNARRLGLAERCHFVTGAWFEPFGAEAEFDLIVSNPPYIDTAAMAALDPSVRDHDPALALHGGADGLDAYRVILGEAGDHLRKDGILAVEIGFDQQMSIENLAAGFDWRKVGQKRDLGDHVRALAFRSP